MKKKAIKLAVLFTAVILVAFAFVACKHEHSLTVLRVLKEATCLEEGEVVYVCDCGHVETGKSEKIGHVAGEWKVIESPTCTEKGTKATFCKSCDLQMDTEEIEANGHALVEVAAKAATCSEVGYKAYEHCSNCGYTTYEEIAKKDHTPGAAATCTEAQYCTVCDAEVVGALGHSLEITEGKAATCEKEGTSDLIECSRCNKLVQEQITIPKREHIPATVLGFAATCSEEGLSDGIVCLLCGEELVEQIDLPVNNEHDFTSRGKCRDCGYDEDDDCEHEDEDEDESWLDNIRGKSPTCDRYGLSEGEYCTECSYITEEQELLEPDEHDVEIVKGYAATLTKPGLTDGEYCRRCKQIVKQQELIPVLSVTESEEAEALQSNGGKLKYKVNSDGKTCKITGIGSCTSANIIIPTTIDSYRVTEIDDEAFYGNTNIVSVVIASSVETIGDKAFAACSKLEKIEMSDSIEADRDAFIASSKLEISYSHSLVYIARTGAECDKPGTKAHYICTNCGSRFVDKEATTPIYNIQISVSHDFDDDDVCEDCGDERSEVYIVDIEDVDDIEVKLGTAAKDLKLPATLTAETEDEDTHTLTVIWDTSEYNGNKEGSYTVTGYILAGGFELGKRLDDEITITVEVED